MPTEIIESKEIYRGFMAVRLASNTALTSRSLHLFGTRLSRSPFSFGDRGESRVD